MKGQKLDLANAFKSEIESALLSKRQGRKDLEWSHLERAHILGQFHALWHLRVHFLMIKYDIRYGNLKGFWKHSVTNHRPPYSLPPREAA